MPSDEGIAVVTGAASGLGKAIATRLAASGYRVVLVDVDVAGGRGVARSLGKGHRFLRGDISRAGDWQKLERSLLDGLGILRVLVNNAAVYAPRPILEEDEASFRRSFGVNQLSVFFGIRMAGRLMSTGGSIVNIASTAGLRGMANTISYSSTKWAVRGMTRVAARELADKGIRVNTILPGLFKTDMALRNDPEMLEALTAAIPSGRLGMPDEVASAVAFLASTDSAYLSGSEIVIDGAATA